MRNKEIGVSGQLCYDARLQRVWQVLEGNPEEVRRTPHVSARTHKGTCDYEGVRDSMQTAN
eukprot:5080045-Amphidinium_carterae.2